MIGVGVGTISQDCFDAASGPTTIDAAIAAISRGVSIAAGEETVRVSEADGRVLARDVTAGIDLPPFDNAAVDGYAFPAGDEADRRFRVASRIAAGDADGRRNVGEAARIMTGARLPAGFDAIGMLEHVEVAKDGTVLRPDGLSSGANIRREGEDLPLGALALPAGTRLYPEAVALLAALGLSEIPVRRRLSVAIWSTGNEIVPAGQPLGEAARYDANGPMLRALMIRAGCDVADLGILPDSAPATREALAEASRRYDLLVTSGGVSAGDEDHVGRAVESLGRLSFWRLAVRPGRPVAMGSVGRTAFLGLPGNPVAAFATFAIIGRPLVARLAGETYRAPIALRVEAAFEHRKKAGLREYIRASLDVRPDGLVVAHKHRDGSGLITSLTRTDGLIELAEDTVVVAQGDMLPFLPYGSLR